MAEKKKIQTEEVTETKRKDKTALKKNRKEKEQFEQLEIEETPKQKKKVPMRIIASAIIGIIFVFLLAIWLGKPTSYADGWLLYPCYQIIRGLFGQPTFYMAIPGFLLMLYIHGFSGNKPVLMRSISLGVFMICFGCIAHWWNIYYRGIDPQLGTSMMAWVKTMWNGGIEGTTGGLICGGITELFLRFFNDIFTLIVLAFTALLTLMASFNITIVSIARAIQNRPRDEDAQERENRDPAAVVVDYFARKNIERKARKRREREEELLEIEEAKRAPVPEAVVMPPVKTPKKTLERAADLSQQIDPDEKPRNNDKIKNYDQLDDSIFTSSVNNPPKKVLTENLPENMPELDMDDLPEEQATAPVAAEVKQKVTAKEAAESAALVAQEIAQNEVVEKPEYRFPPIDLLKSSSGSSVDGTAEMRENSRRLNETLASFKIEAHIINVTRGPSVTRYEVELDKGVRLNKLTTIADDIALSIGASGVRIAAVPGKISVVGIEVPNRAVSPVSLREVIDSNEFRNAKSKTTFSVGKDIGGNCITGNIAKLPHMLIAGTTGSGKSVCMNSIIISLLYKASPDDVKLIMIDPKMVELGIYNAIPHLLIPVVTDPKKAAGSLQWAVTEMMRRYKAMSDAGVRDLESFNAIVEAEGEGAKLPQVVVIIDELADLMMVAAKEVEESICRIAQMGRASGIHLVIATQRPSADVITGLMKANIPSRIAFAVSSAMESRIILDTMGAEKLVGKGDMLFAPIGSGKPMRVQGCFVSDAEVEAVATYVKENFNVDYDNSIMADIEKRASQTGTANGKGGAAAAPEANDSELDGDDMLPAAVDVILETNQASVSMLQRRLKLGYARAARIVDEMEEKGFVGPFQGSKPRDILITKEQWAAMRGGHPEQMEMDGIPFDEGVPEEID